MSTDANGNLISQARFTPFGEELTWAGSGEAVTDFGFTGQRSERGFRLMDYNARFYSSSLGRFISADTIVPGAGNPMAWDRFAYVQNNPVRNVDPSGHLSCSNEHVAEGDCSDMSTRQILEELYGVVLTEAEGYEGFWDDAKISAVYAGVHAVGAAFASERSTIGTAAEAFSHVYRTSGKDPMILEYNPDCPECADKNGKIGGAYTHNSHYIQFASMASDYYADVALRWRNHVVHELGHAFNGAMANQYGYAYGSPYADFSPVFSSDELYQRQTNATAHSGFAEEYQIRTWQQSTTNSYGEVFADMFVAWTFNAWETNPDGSYTNRAEAKSSWMTTNMAEWIK